MANIKNIAIIAHVDHGKTTLVDKIMYHCQLFRENENTGDLILDNNDLERIYVDAFLAEQLARRDYSQAHYKLTSAIANVLFEDAKKANISNSANIAGFAYPSVSHRGGVNFVIMGDFFEYFEIVEATAIKINAHLNYNLYGRTPYASCQVIDDKGNLHWIICEGNLII